MLHTKQDNMNTEEIHSLSKYNIKVFGINKIKFEYSIPDNEEIRLFWAASITDIVSNKTGSPTIQRKKVFSENSKREFRIKNGIALTNKNLYYLINDDSNEKQQININSIKDVKVSPTLDLCVITYTGEIHINSSYLFPESVYCTPELQKKECLSAIANAIKELISQVTIPSSPQKVTSANTHP